MNSILLNFRSFFSFYEGTSSMEEMCSKVRESGYSSLALTDVNGVYGALFFQECALKEGLKPIHGAEIRMGEESVIILVENERGWRNLCRIITEVKRLEEGSHFSFLLENLEGCFLISSSSPLLEEGVRRGWSGRIFSKISPFSSRKKMMEISKNFKIPPVAMAEVRFIKPEDYEIQRLLTAIKYKITLEEVPVHPSDSLHLCPLSPEKLLTFFSHVPEAMENARVLRERCNFLIPCEPVVPRIEGFENPQGILEKLVWKGLKERYGEINSLIRERAKRELEIIKEKNFSVFFLIAREICRNFPVHCARGSVANSILAYSLYITDVDPLKNNLPFERFLNPSRNEPPDIDLDFPWDERERVRRFVEERFGEENVAFISTHVKFGQMGSFRETARAFGFSEKEISRAEEALLYFPEKLMKQKIWREILNASRRIKEIPHHISAHPGGMIMGSEPVYFYVPTEFTSGGIKVVQWEKEQCEMRGFFKLDLLGNRSLSVIRDVVELVKDVKYSSIPEDSLEAKRAFSEGNTLGIFYTESPASRILCRKTKSGDYPILVINTSIIRPAANKYIREYLNRLFGIPSSEPHPLLRELLKETFGILVYQEDVMKLCSVIAGMDSGTADKLRKTLCKKSRSLAIEEFKEIFFKGGKLRGYEDDFLEEVWDMILSFSGYSFCKGHSCSYINVAMKACYLKTHYPAHFMCAVINNRGGYYDTFTYISEAKRMGIKILPPHINESERLFSVKGDSLIPGFAFIKGLRDFSIEGILEERSKGGPFKDFTDFLLRVSIPPSDTEKLIKVGAFREIDSKPEPAMIIEARSRRRVENPHNFKFFSLFQRIQHEYELLGFPLSGSLFDLWREELMDIPTNISERIDGLKEGDEIIFAGLLTTFKPVLTKNGLPMEFITFEDEKGLVECVLFPDGYRKYAFLLNSRGPYILEGKIEREFGVSTVNLRKIKTVRRKNYYHTSTIS